MSRESSNVEIGGVVRDGYDYDLQVWVLNYIVQDCGHPKEMHCERYCNSRKFAGRDIRTINN